MLADRSRANKNLLVESFFKKEGILVVEHRLSPEDSFIADPPALNTDYNSESDSCELRIENLTDDFTVANPI
jgi:hypothetical protein